MAEVNVTRLSINVHRLLAKCEEMVNRGDVSENWRLPKFVDTVEQMVNELEEHSEKSEKTQILILRRRVRFLKRLLETQMMEDTLEKSVAIQMLSPPSVLDSIPAQEIYQKTLANCENDVRKELFQGSSELRHRSVLTEPSGSQELDHIIKYHNEKHEQIADDMLTMTRNMKEQSELAGKIIREDTKVLEGSVKSMDNNYLNLEKQSNRLQVFISKSSWNCLTWIILAIIIVIFLNMIFFMKVSKKRY